MRLGLIGLNKNKACRGYVLFCTSFFEGRFVLIDLEGDIVHEWRFPFWPQYSGYLLPTGNLFFAGRPSHEPLPEHGLAADAKLVESDWNGRIVWQCEAPVQHHDARRTSTGGAIYLSVMQLPAETVAQVKGGIPGTDAKGMWGDTIVEVDESGRRTWEWNAYEHLDFDKHILPSDIQRSEWTHANSVVPLADNRVMVSFRHTSTIAIIDKLSSEILWSVGDELLSGQHDPNVLPNGNILVFDNGFYRTSYGSRVIEIDTETKSVVWEYHDRPMMNFYSAGFSSARRLPNGNTLITEGLFGRMFQVTHEGEVVWEYVNPFFTSNEYGVVVNSVFRAIHYAPNDIPQL